MSDLAPFVSIKLVDSASLDRSPQAVLDTDAKMEDAELASPATQTHTTKPAASSSSSGGGSVITGSLLPDTDAKYRLVLNIPSGIIDGIAEKKEGDTMEENEKEAEEEESKENAKDKDAEEAESESDDTSKDEDEKTESDSSDEESSLSEAHKSDANESMKDDQEEKKDDQPTRKSRRSSTAMPAVTASAAARTTRLKREKKKEKRMRKVRCHPDGTPMGKEEQTLKKGGKSKQTNSKKKPSTPATVARKKETKTSTSTKKVATTTPARTRKPLTTPTPTPGSRASTREKKPVVVATVIDENATNAASKSTNKPVITPEAAAPLVRKEMAFPNFPIADVPNVGSFDDSIHDMFKQIDPALDIATLLPAVESSRAPSSQRLHITRTTIYRELCEEYFGRYLKDTPDVIDDEFARVERGVQRSSTRVHKVINSKKETPETLRMIFCAALNKCEADRVPSSAGRSEKAGLVMVAPLPSALQLKSLAASDASSLQRAMDPIHHVPPTFEEYQSQWFERDHHAASTADSTTSSPTLVNPHFDLFQYAPFILADQYEYTLDDYTHHLLHSRTQQKFTIHPILPKFHHQSEIKKENSPRHSTVKEESDSIVPSAASSSDMQAASAASSSDSTLAGISTTATSASSSLPTRPLGAYGGNKNRMNNAASSHKDDTDMMHGKDNESEHKSQMKMSDSLRPSIPASMDPQPDEEKSFVSVKIKSEEQLDVPMVDQLDSSICTASLDDSKQVSMLIDVDTSSTSSTTATAVAAAAMPSTAAVAVTSSVIPSMPASFAAPIALPPVSTLPNTTHGVGMFSSLDFSSSQCDNTLKTHWTNSSYSWRFDNQTRTFLGRAYDPSNSAENDVASVMGTIHTAQRLYHRAMQFDEEEEKKLEELEAIQIKQNPAKRQKREPATESKEETKDETNEEKEDIEYEHTHKVAPYAPTSLEYSALRNRIRSEFEASLMTSLFLPHTFLKEVAPRLHSRAIDMSRECVKDLNTKFKLPPEEQEVDSVFGLVVPGFGCSGTQVFLKIGLSVTLLHDEIGWCSALNYMTVRSRGCALWIGLNMHKASVRWPKEKLRQLINATTFNLSDFMAQMKKAGLQPSMQVQTPGTCIYSPCGRGSAHIVITVGSWVEQIAINHGMSAPGLNASMHFWDGAEPLLHNSALATRCVIPLMWLQKHAKWEVGLSDQLDVLEALEQRVKKIGKHKIDYRDYSSAGDQETYCRKCFNEYTNRRASLYQRIDGMCPSCFVEAHPNEYTDFATLIDRRFK